MNFCNVMYQAFTIFVVMLVVLFVVFFKVFAIVIIVSLVAGMWVYSTVRLSWKTKNTK